MKGQAQQFDKLRWALLNPKKNVENISHVKGTKTFLWKLKNLKKVHPDAVLVAADKVGLNLSIS